MVGAVEVHIYEKKNMKNSGGGGSQVSRVTQIQNGNINVVYDEFVYEEKESMYEII